MSQETLTPDSLARIMRDQLLVRVLYTPHQDRAIICFATSVPDEKGSVWEGVYEGYGTFSDMHQLVNHATRYSCGQVQLHNYTADDPGKALKMVTKNWPVWLHPEFSVPKPAVAVSHTQGDPITACASLNLMMHYGRAHQAFAVHIEERNGTSSQLDKTVWVLIQRLQGFIAAQKQLWATVGMNGG